MYKTRQPYVSCTCMSGDRGYVRGHAGMSGVTWVGDHAGMSGDHAADIQSQGVGPAAAGPRRIRRDARLVGTRLQRGVLATLHLTQAPH